ncbi:hypothetical protein L4X63_18020 [Geomonas sp. Red32]|uniref:hypothetical protein n=1 Tax=Geomonas sp. Red32 TaxID=2912856 RepID=UPI00202CE23B|nr:hypothetical protein [Geomonas sp. Red32]MCM0083486.1 hypothetical protein [Geomonas sp. Red32]
MTNREIIETVRAFEMTHPVESYRFFDWNVWPLIREETLIVAMMPPRVAAPTGSWGAVVRDFLHGHRHLRPLTRMLGSLRARQSRREMERTWAREWDSLLALDPSHNDDPVAPGREVVLFTLSGRRVQTREGLYEIYADPLVEYLDRKGVSSLLWERGVPRHPRRYRSAWVSRLLEREALLIPDPPPLKEPPWFQELAAFSAAVSGRYRNWHEVQADIIYLQKLSLVFEKWLRATGAKLLVSVCWYGLDVMAATLAARRVGVVTVDLQHGVQGRDHHGYSGWAKVPPVPYEVVPDLFWCWGEEQKRTLLAENEAFAAQCDVAVCGNLWLNKWHTDGDLGGEEGGELARSTAGFEKTILVTLQTPGEFTDFIVEAVRESPPGWFWLLRFHPATPEAERAHFEEKLQSVRRANFETEQASRMAMYALMQLSDVQVTGYSTSAQEALFFGIPTVTVTANGASALKGLVDAGIVLHVETLQELFEALKRCETISSKQCQDSVQNYFAPPQVAGQGIDQLLSRAGICCRGAGG